MAKWIFVFSKEEWAFFYFFKYAGLMYGSSVLPVATIIPGAELFVVIVPDK